jgi:hypothetical protein
LVQVNGSGLSQKEKATNKEILLLLIFSSSLQPYHRRGQKMPKAEKWGPLSLDEDLVSSFLFHSLSTNVLFFETEQ